MTDLFEEKAKDWDVNERTTNLASSISTSILEHVHLDKHMTVMDFGAGTGLISSQIAPKVNRITAVDISRAMLEKLANKPGLKDKIEIACQDIVETPLDARFDVIVSAMALHHVEDTSRLMQRFSEHLKQEGKLALADLDKEQGDFHPPGTEGVYHFGFDREELGGLLEQHGFTRIEFNTAHILKGETTDYPIFLVTAQKSLYAG